MVARIVRRTPDAIIIGIAILALPLFTYGLNDTYLWQDEAQTALLGRSVRGHGLPMVGVGSESLSAVQGRDAGVGGIYFQISWLQAYLMAASFTIFGESSWSARIPFALAGWSCVPLVAWTVRKAGSSVLAARLAALLMAFSVPFIVGSRQARYYALTAVLTVLTVGTYAALSNASDERHEPTTALSLAFGAAASLLALSFDLTAMGVLATLALHRALTTPAGDGRWAPAFWVPWAASCVLLGTWLGIEFHRRVTP